jgi:hypothetical protein
MVGSNEDVTFGSLSPNNSSQLKLSPAQHAVLKPTRHEQLRTVDCEREVTTYLFCIATQQKYSPLHHITQEELNLEPRREPALKSPLQGGRGRRSLNRHPPQTYTLVLPTDRHSCRREGKGKIRM